MSETLTIEQKLAVEDRGGKLLVSAAAGSGKTKVLVDRLMGYILDPVDPANIDDFLIITYTKAAAAELRGKIASKLSELIALYPQNKHLQHQIQRLYLANISTVHGFCGDVLRQYAYRLDIGSDFRVADENECVQLQYKALEQILNDAYDATDDAAFYSFVDSQGLGRDDRRVPEIVLKVYNSARCHVNPDIWLEECFTFDSDLQDAAQTPWGKYLVDDLKLYLTSQIDAFKRCISACSGLEGMEKPAALLNETCVQLDTLLQCNTWDEIYNCKDVDFGRLTFPKKCSDLQLAEQIKAVRNACKSRLAKYLRSFSAKSEQVLSDLKISLQAAEGLVALVRAFSAEYDMVKKSRGVLDFGDLEHATLDLFYGKTRSGLTSIAIEVGGKYREVMVDEYQDSNEIQDSIFSALTQKQQNCFMVGDVKQSIYQFRLADPGIFIQKYNSYVDATDAMPGEGRKVLLSKNFRSSAGVISAVNDIFTQCMSTGLGGLDYGEQERLREGVPHISLNEPEVSLYGITVESDTYAEEAAFVADKIAGLLDGNHMVRERDVLRPICPEDIVVLLRSPGSVGSTFQNALQNKGIRCVTGDSADLLHTEEIETIRSLLQIVCNPLQDIPLVATLTSPIFRFSADDLAQLRCNNRYNDIYTLLCNSDKEKCKEFLQILNHLRSCARIMSVTQLLTEIFSEINFYGVFGAMQDGETKCKNLNTFFQIVSSYEATGPKDLSRFLEFLDTTEDRGLMGVAGQQDKGAVTIMSIHKSKGLEFPVVFLCGLSRSFNQESAHAQVLCDKELGLGLDCYDSKLRVRFPTIAKQAVSTKLLRDSVSEELRVLYVALTRARDRLYMTYAARNLQSDLQDIAMRLDMCSNQQLASEADCPGWWVLQAALTRTEAGALFALAGHPDCASVKADIWNIEVVETADASSEVFCVSDLFGRSSNDVVDKFKTFLNYSYNYHKATRIPSKLTATQLKGRSLDFEVSDGAEPAKTISFRKPGKNSTQSGTAYGNAVHSVLQHIDYSVCNSADDISNEIVRLENEGLITHEQAVVVDCDALHRFFDSDFGRNIKSAECVLREFKFSILIDAKEFYPEINDEHILLQGVVDLALIENDGITVLDFKTDYLTEDTLSSAIERYKSQVQSYAHALSRIYQKPIKSAMLYFFKLNCFVDVL